jgi:cysteine-rich repeat protein
MCAPICGDGQLLGAEACDDNDTDSGDGCSATCTIETGFTCAGAPSVCTAICGDGLVLGAEACDDDDTDAGDGCSATCTIETGFTCTGMPSMCTPICGDGLILGAEACDDADADAGDGCSATCTIEVGYGCVGMPSMCSPECGDGLVIAPETCDDDNIDAGDGCSNGCTIETGYSCMGMPSMCAAVCGDGLILGPEECDDADADAGDGCSATCTIENGYNCTGEPSVCVSVCGDGVLIAPEQCDDDNTIGGDCCSATCQVEVGCEQESNDTFATATDWDLLNVGGQMKAFITPATDKDIYSFTVPAGTTGAVTAETLDGFLGTSCASNLVDTRITIFNGAFVQLILNDDKATNFCSRVSAIGLAPGEYYIEVIDSPLGNALTFDYTLALTITLAPCGDNIISNAVGEQCDDGAFINGDGCSGLCRLECINEVEPNGTAVTANGPFTPTNELGSFHCGAVNALADADFYRIDLTATADLRIETFDLNGPSLCSGNFATVVQLRASDGVTVLASNSTAGVNNCSLLDSSTAVAARHLAPGTYYVRVEESGNNQLIGGYSVLVSYNALCGDGVIEGFEECDGGPTCTATCDRAPACGDGFIDAPEVCDDSNMLGGDGCSSACQFEVQPEVEPNGTTAQADARALDPTPVLITGDARVSGSINVVGDLDLFRIQLAAPQVVRFETFNSAGLDCGGLTTTLRVLDSGGLLISTDAGLVNSSYASGIGTGVVGQGLCSALVLNLAAGTYYARVEETGGDGVIAAYQLQVKTLASAGSEAEVNNTLAQANVITGRDVFVLGGHQVISDTDFYAITVPQGGSVRAEIIEGNAETCESQGVDSFVSLLNAAGTVLTSDDLQGRGFCSLIDGTGAATSIDPGAHNLDAGTYYLKVEAANQSNMNSAQFDYRLAITIRTP